MISRFLKKLCFIIASVSDNLGDCGETASNLFNATVAACAKLVSENSAMLPNLQLFRCTCHSSLILFVGGGGGEGSMRGENRGQNLDLSLNPSPGRFWNAV